MAALAALAVFFTTLVGAILGLRSADQRSIDVVRALGGSSFTALRKVRIKAALPSLFAALRISAPAAILGAMLGEFMGADRGLGQFLVAAKAQVDQERVWGIALVTTAVAGLGYLLIAVVGRLLTPWAPRGGDR
jgi:ABC-type nitrate/sulfonate/bicarbonate transport system permease component